MVLHQRSDPILEQAEPPFLQEPTIVVASGPTRQPMDLFVDFVYRWRLVLALGLIPVLLAALALSVEPNQPDDPLVESGGGERSALGGMLNGVVAADDEQAEASPTGSEGTPPTLTAAPPVADGSTTTESTSEAPKGSSSRQAERETSAPSSTSSTTQPTTPSTTVASTTPPETDPSPTTASTAEVTTTAAPTTAAEPGCVVAVRRNAPLRASPDDDSDRVGRVKRGSYPALDVRDGWFQISERGTTGWIDERFVGGVEGNC